MAGIAWITFVFAREFSSLKSSFVVDSPPWLVFTIVMGCVALLITVPIFRSLLANFSSRSISLGHAAHMLFVAQILRHLPGRFWGVAYLVNQTHEQIPAASMVRANVDFMLYSMGFNVLVAVFLFIGVSVGPGPAVLLATLGSVLMAFGLRQNWIGQVASKMARIMPERARGFASAFAEQPRLSWQLVAGISIGFILVWCCYLAIWWALSQVFTVLGSANIWLLCAAYMLAWVIGYLAMVTPGGLGVREAGFFALASPLMSLPELTFLAVFIRLWQILVESLMFLAFAFVKPVIRNSHDQSASSV